MLSLVRRALDRLRANRAPWQDYVIGAGLAFDPLPSRRRPYEDSDRIALAPDLLQLVRDRDAVLDNSDLFGTTPRTREKAA